MTLRANACLCLAYAAAGWLGLLLAVPPGYASPVFPAAGLALGCVLVLGWRLLPGVWAGSVLLNLCHGYELTGSINALPAVTVGCAAALQAWAGAWLVRRFASPSLRLDEPGEVVRFMLITVGSCVVAATLALGGLYLLGAMPASGLVFSWWNWWLGDATGAIIFTPLTLLALARRGLGWRSRRWAVGLPLLVALGVQILLYLQFSAWEADRVRQTLERDAELVQRTLREAVQPPVEVLGSLRQFIENSESVTDEEFHRFVKPWLANNASVLALGRAQSVPAGSRSAFESQMRAEGKPDFAIVSRAEVGPPQPVPPGDDQDRLVVSRVEPAAPNRLALGLDLYTVAISSQAIARSRQQNQAAATRPFRLTQQRDPHARGIVVYLAHRAHAAADSETVAGPAFGGVVFAAFSLDVLIERLARATRQGLAICLLDSSEVPAIRIAGKPGCEQHRDGPFVARSVVAVGDRAWALRAEASPEYLAAQTGVLRWWAPAFGMLGSALLVAFVLTSAGRTRRVQMLVEQRTAELRAATDRFSGMLERIKLAAVQLDVEGRVSFCNDYLLNLLGYRADEVIGRDWFSLVLPEARREPVRKVFQRLISDGAEPQHFENEIFTRAGERRYLAWNNTLLRDAAGKVLGIASIGEDITLRHLSDLEREKAWALLHAAIAQSPAGILIVDAPSMRLRMVNPAAMRIRGRQPSEMTALEDFVQGWQVFHPDGSVCEVADLPLARAVRGAQTTENAEFIVRDEAGQERWVAANAAPVRAADGRIIAGIVVFNDVTLIKEQQQRLAHMAHYDALTRLPNRTLLADRLELGLQQAERDGKLLAVAYLDLDGFKGVNDRLGHEAGDNLLIDVAGRLRGALRGGDTVARIGGDEFVLLLRELGDFAECEHALKRVLAEVSAPYLLEGEMVEVSGSIGVTVYPTDGADPDTLLRHADQAMYVAKQSGRNRYHLFDAELDRRAHVERALLGSIGIAITQNQLVLHYQPRVDLHTGRVVGVEALVRWQHPERGLLPPSEFLPQIEGHALSIALGEWVIAEAVGRLAQWLSHGIELQVSINIAARHLQSATLMSFISQTLREHPSVPASALELEILETAAIEDLQQVSGVIDACKRLGIRAAIDDFGTGYSSLSYFKRLPAEVIKIDQSFIRDMLGNPEDMAIVEGVIELTRVFSRTAVAEGVETEQHGLMLLALGCDQAQGYAISRPLNAQALVSWLANYQPFESWRRGVKQLRREDFPLLAAEVEHHQWIEQLRTALAAQAGDLRAPRLSAIHCRLGKWLETADATRAGVADIRALHERLHQRAEALCELHDAGERAAAAASLAEVVQLQERLFKCVRVFIGVS
ncbi:EAL domain-containing protein [Niveibacterium sp. 24ML]|uniref:EAL domain-containing protein n=1 Tax=Niveibacterium sp. 24ML TaxID=2985512 RepID=UPI00226EA07F|nr:EAL domain-containing protein [Niveibacterium sp. 24ML]MCX9155965.1 EAL domain-containing protein [Niveibacterium sp. 24ML]